MLTADTEESRIALKHIISSATGRKVTFAEVKNSERIFSGREMRGKPYGELHKVYTIFILAEALFKDTPDFYDENDYYSSLAYAEKRGREKGFIQAIINFVKGHCSHTRLPEFSFCCRRGARSAE